MSVRLTYGIGYGGRLRTNIASGELLLRPLYDCSVVDVQTQEVLATVRLPSVPRIGDDLRLTGDGYAGKVFRVVSVQYEIHHRQRLQLGHLSAVTIGVETGALA